MKNALVVLLILVGSSARAAADTDFAIEPLQLVVRVPDSAGEWKYDPSMSEPGQVTVFDGDALHVLMDMGDDTRTCADFIASAQRQDASGTTYAASQWGLDTTWWSTEVYFVAKPDQKGDELWACTERAGRALLGGLSMPRTETGRQQSSAFLNALADAWGDRIDGEQRVDVDGVVLVVGDRAAIWYRTPDDGLIRVFAQPKLFVAFERNQIGGGQVTGDDSETCESWTSIFGEKRSGASFLPAGWHPDAGFVDGDEDVTVYACLSRRDGGSLVAQILYGGDPASADFADAMRPLLTAVAAEIGVVAVYEEAAEIADPTTEWTAPAPVDEVPRRPRDPYQAYRAPMISARFVRVAPTLEGVEPGIGFALAAEKPALRGEEYGEPLLWTARAMIGYEPDAGVLADARIAAGYDLGSERAHLVPLVGIGVDMFDHGDDAAPFHVAAGVYAYLGAILRYEQADRAVFEVQGATVQRAGIYEELEVAARAIVRRGSRRTLSAEVAWRRYMGETEMTTTANMLTIGVGVGL